MDDNKERLPTIQSVRMEIIRRDSDGVPRPEAKVPFRKRPTDAGFDIASIERKELAPGKATIVHTGICLAAPPGHYYTIEGRSGLWSIGIVPNRGIIDSTYCGEVVVSLVNFTGAPYFVEIGERIAQIIIHKQYDAEFVEVAEFSPLYNQRGTAGFGSSGR